MASQQVSTNQERLSREILALSDVCKTHSRSGGFGIEIGDNTCFDHERIVLIIGLQDLIELGFNNINEFLFALLHESKHYLDMAHEPEAYRALIQKGARADGLGQVYFGFYNALEDIGVNKRVSYDVAAFRTGDKGSDFSPLIKRIYTNKLFADKENKIPAKRDFSKQLLSRQFSDYLLNLGMGCADDIVLSPEVEKIIKGNIDTYAGAYSFKEFIKTFITPAAPGLSALGDKLESRIKYIDQFLLPIFESLIKQDIANGKTEQLKEGKGKGLPISSPDQLGKALDTIIKKKIEGNKTPAQKAKEAFNKSLKDLGQNCNLNEEDTKRFITAWNRASQIMGALTRIWREIPQKSKSFVVAEAGYYESGHEMDLQEVIFKWPAIASGKVVQDVFLREELTEKVELKPGKFRLRLVVDASSSMKGKRSMLELVTLALAGSINKINNETQNAVNKFECELQIATFHQTGKIVMPLKLPDMKDIMQVYPKFFEYGDATRDAMALGKILKEVRNAPADERVERENGNLFELVLVITDGDSHTAKASKLLIPILESHGLIVKAVRIGKSEQFDSIWNADGIKRGKEVEKPDKLADVVFELIRAEIDNIRRKLLEDG